MSERVVLSEAPGGRSVNPNVPTIYLSPAFSNILIQLYDIASALWEVCWSILNIHPFSETALLRSSIVLIGCQHLQTLIEANADTVELQLTQLPSALIWGVPLILSSLIAFFVTLPHWWRPSHDDAFIITALISLFCLEAVLPFIVLTCTSLLLLRQVNWVTGLTVLAVVWIMISFTAHWIRCTVYQSMGHG